MTPEYEHFRSALGDVLSQATECLKRHDAVQAFDILGPTLTRVSQVGGATFGTRVTAVKVPIWGRVVCGG